MWCDVAGGDVRRPGEPATVRKPRSTVGGRWRWAAGRTSDDSGGGVVFAARVHGCGCAPRGPVVSHVAVRAVVENGARNRGDLRARAVVGDRPPGLPRSGAEMRPCSRWPGRRRGSGRGSGAPPLRRPVPGPAYAGLMRSGRVRRRRTGRPGGVGDVGSIEPPTVRRWAGWRAGPGRIGGVRQTGREGEGWECAAGPVVRAQKRGPGPKSRPPVCFG